MASHGRIPGLVTQERPRAVKEPCRGHQRGGPSPGLPRRTRRPVYPHLHGMDAGVSDTARKKPARSSPSRHRFLPRHSLCPWQLFAGSAGVGGDADIPVLLVAAVIPVTLVLANAIAAVPGWTAARIRPALILRSE